MDTALRPSFMRNDRSPLAWGSDEWDAASRRRACSPLLDEVALETHLDRAAFLRDGVAVLPGVMTAAARKRWAQATQKAQDLNDRMIRAAPSWPELIDWPKLGRAQPPAKVLAADDIANALGTSQAIKTTSAEGHGQDPVGIQTLRYHSVIPEYFPAGHVGELMDVLNHPQMIELNSRLLGCSLGEVRFDHNQLLNRRPGYPGGAWHSHKIGGGLDDVGCEGDLKAYDAQPNLAICLCYPEGFQAEDDGGLGIIRGSHLFRDTHGCRASADPESGKSADDVMAAGWMKGKTHPITGAPLRIERFGLPPGSIAVVLSHGAHGVAPKAHAKKKTRLCTLFAYRKAAGDVIPSPGRQVPPCWAAKARRGELPAWFSERLQGVGDIYSTGGLKAGEVNVVAGGPDHEHNGPRL